MMREARQIDGAPSESRHQGGGGQATAAGVGFQAYVGAWFASCHLLAERRLAPVLSGGRVHTISFETQSSVDDILISTEQGRVFIQAKTSISLFGSTGRQARGSRRSIRGSIPCLAYREAVIIRCIRTATDLFWL